jgi:hypothetical protein
VGCGGAGPPPAKNYRIVLKTAQLTGLPIIKIDTLNNISISSKDEYVYTNLQIIDSNNPSYNITYTEYKDRIRGRGNSTWQYYPKKPYKIKLDKKTNLLGMGSDKDWVLLANYTDKTLLRTAIAFKLSEMLEFPWTPKAAFVELFLNGEYMGNYQLVESVKREVNRVNIPENGYIIEWDAFYQIEPKYFVTNYTDSFAFPFAYTFKNPDTDDLTNAQFNYIKDFMLEFETILASPYYNDPANGYAKYINAESFARWWLFQQIIANYDTNTFLYKADNTYNSKLFMGPVWDFEWSLGVGWYNGQRPRPADYWVQNGAGRWYFEKLLTDISFVEKITTLWNEHKTAVRSDIIRYINQLKDYLEKSQVMNFKKWDIMNIQITADGNPVGGIPAGGYDAEIETDKQFFNNHLDWLDTALSSFPLNF